MSVEASLDAICKMRESGVTGLLKRVGIGSVTGDTNDQNGFVYFVGRIGEIKIGMAHNVYARVGELARGLSFLPTIHHMIHTENMKKLEAQFHKYYKDKRVYYEWFNLSESDIEYIKTLSGPNEEMVKTESNIIESDFDRNY